MKHFGRENEGVRISHVFKNLETILSAVKRTDQKDVQYSFGILKQILYNHHSLNTNLCMILNWILDQENSYKRLYQNIDKIRQYSYISVKPSDLISVLQLCKRMALLRNKYLEVFYEKEFEVSNLLSNDLGKLHANVCI